MSFALWDLPRFLRTLIFFEALPWLGCLQNLLAANSCVPTKPMKPVNLNSNHDDLTLLDFSQPDSDLKGVWGPVDDVVMGGVSASEMRFLPGKAVFSGQVSTANNGGFASVRTKNWHPPLDLSAYSGLELKIQGDGKRYKLILRSDDTWDGVGYSYSFDSFNNHAQTIRIPFNKLIPSVRAKTRWDMGAFDPRYLSSIQVMYSKFEYDGQLNPTFSPGFFSLDIFSVKAYKP